MKTLKCTNNGGYIYNINGIYSSVKY